MPFAMVTSAHNRGLPLKVLEIHWAFAPTTGGVESHLADLARLLVHDGCEVTVLTGEPQPLHDGRYEIITTQRLNLERIRNGPSYDGSMASDFFELLAEVVSRKSIDIIHGHNLHHFDAGPALAIERLRRRHDIGVHHTFHETWPDVLQAQPVYRHWQGNYAVSRFVQRQCSEWIGFEPELMPLGVDTQLFHVDRPCFDNVGRAVVLHPARLLPWKGVDIALRMLRKLLDRGQDVCLAMTDTQRIVDWNSELHEYRARIMALIAELRLGDRVRFVQASYREMPRVYELADIVVYPTRAEEPLGLVPLEAMSCGRPVVASLSGGIAETVVDGRTGYVVPKDDVEALADRVDRLLRAPALARGLGTEGRRWVEEHFDGRRYAKALQQRFHR